MLTYADLIERFTRWAEAEEDVRAALILGSRARKDHPADEWSDLDVLVHARAFRSIHPIRRMGHLHCTLLVDLYRAHR